MKTIQYFVVSMVLILLLACGGAPTKANYDKVKNGMSYSEVVDILGSPEDDNSAGIGSLSARTVTWEGKDITISIQFLNDKVKLKSFK